MGFCRGRARCFCFQGIVGVGGDGGGGAAGVGGLHHNAELGGVAVRHDEMVAADVEEELPPGTQESINEVDMMVRGLDAGAHTRAARVTLRAHKTSASS